jgi:molecular chaperone Hsp33
MRDLGYGQPFTSTVELVSGEIGDDVTYYLAHSEQTPSALALGELMGSDGVKSAGGLLIQVLPKAAQDDALVKLVEFKCGDLSQFSTLLQSGQALGEIMTGILGDLNLRLLPETQKLRFYCPCSFKRVLGALKMLGQAELQDMIEKDGGAEVTCDFCGEVYRVDASQLAQLIGELELREV